MRKLLAVLMLFLFLIQCKAQEKRFSADIRKFQKEDRIRPQKEVILFIGSSTFTLWGELMKRDFANDTILNRAFGASSLLDLIGYEKEILFAYHPKKIFIYCGENDIANAYPKVKGKEVAKRFKKLYRDIRLQFPTIPVVFVSIKPSASRWQMRDKMIDANQRIKKYLEKEPNAHFVNIWNVLLDESGKPNDTLYRDDALHLNEKGYKVLTGILEQYVNGGGSVMRH